MRARGNHLPAAAGLDEAVTKRAGHVAQPAAVAAAQSSRAATGVSVCWRRVGQRSRGRGSTVAPPGAPRATEGGPMSIVRRPLVKGNRQGETRTRVYLLISTSSLACPCLPASGLPAAGKDPGGRQCWNPGGQSGPVHAVLPLPVAAGQCQTPTAVPSPRPGHCAPPSLEERATRSSQCTVPKPVRRSQTAGGSMARS